MPSGCNLISFRVLGEGKSEERGRAADEKTNATRQTNYRQPPPASQWPKQLFSRELARPTSALQPFCYLDSKRHRDKCSLFLFMTREKARKKSSARSTKDKRGRRASFLFLPHAKSDELQSP